MRFSLLDFHVGILFHPFTWTVKIIDTPEIISVTIGPISVFSEWGYDAQR